MAPKKPSHCLGICLKEPPGNAEEGDGVCVPLCMQRQMKHHLALVNFVL